MKYQILRPDYFYYNMQIITCQNLKFVYN